MTRRPASECSGGSVSRRRKRERILSLLLLLGVAAACGSGGDELSGQGPSGPTIVPVDSIRLLEEDTLYIGHPRPPSVDPIDGSIYISDTFAKRVLRFDRSGNLGRTYGRPGDGPGEFGFNALVFVLDDSTVAVVDEREGRLELFDRGSGEHRKARVFYEGGQAMAGSTVPARIGDDLWFASVDPMERTALARWSVAGGTMDRTGAMPAEYEASLDEGTIAYANHMYIGSLVGVDDRLVRGWMPRNDLFIYSLEGIVVDTLELPTVRRRGVPENLRHLYDVERISTSERLTLHSRLRQLHTLPDGGIAFVHNDQEIISDDGPLPVMAAHVWLGVTSPDLERACVDTRVPASLDAMAAAGFRGDSLFVVDRPIVEEELETWLIIYRIETEGCDWLPIGEE